MSGQLVLVTGVTGFIAGQIVENLLESGYRVRGTARGSKANHLIEVTDALNLEIVQIDDVAKSDLTQVLRDVYAVIHVACPLPGQASVDDTLTTAVEGTLNVLRQASKLGIEKIVITSSFGACVDPSLKQGFAGRNLTESDWGSVTPEEIAANSANPFFVYFASKNLAEKAAWDFAREHPNMDIATILPGFVFGPYSRHFPRPSSKSQFKGTNQFPYALITDGTPLAIPPWVVDVRDVAQAHVRALELPKASAPTTLTMCTAASETSPHAPNPTSNPEVKRFIVNGGNLTWKEAAHYLKLDLSHSLPDDVRARVKDVDAIAALPGVPSTLDSTRAREVLGLDFVPPSQVILDTIQELVQLEESWVI